MNNTNNEHSMITRSKKKQLEDKPIDENNSDIFETLDENGNLIDLIDNDCESDFDNKIKRLSIDHLFKDIK